MHSFTADQVRLGFIGVGAMGSRLVRRLLEREYQVVVYDLDSNKAAELASSGAVAVETIQELVDSSDVILSCLTNDSAVKEVYVGRSGVFARIQPGRVVLEMSTVAPETSRDIHGLHGPCAPGYSRSIQGEFCRVEERSCCGLLFRNPADGAIG